MGALSKELGSSVSPKYICWVLLGLAGQSFLTGVMGAFKKKLGSYERSLRWKISLKNISVGFQQLNQTNRNSGKLKTIKTRIIY
jgi:hypothetical protein